MKGGGGGGGGYGRMVIMNCIWKNKNDSFSEEPKPRETISTHQTNVEEWEKKKEQQNISSSVLFISLLEFKLPGSKLSPKGISMGLSPAV